MRGSHGWLAVVAALLTGCAGAPLGGTTRSIAAEDDVPRWKEFLTDRAYDLLDVASLRVAVGPGLLAHARVTEWLAAGVGSLGPDHTWSSGLSMNPRVLGWHRREGGLWIERRAEMGLSTFYYCEAEVEVLAGQRDRIGADARDRFDVGAELHLGLAGFGGEIRLDELLDFLVGWVGNDPALDDRRALD